MPLLPSRRRLPAPRTRRAAASRPGSSCSATSCWTSCVAPDRELELRQRRDGPRPAAAGRVGGDGRSLARPGRGAQLADLRDRARRAGPGARRGAGRATGSPSAPCGSPASGPAASASSSTRRASARSSPSAARPSSSGRRTSARPGSAAPMRSTCPAYSLLDQPLGDAGLAASRPRAGRRRAGLRRPRVARRRSSPEVARRPSSCSAAPRRTSVRHRATRPAPCSAAGASASSSSSPRSRSSSAAARARRSSSATAATAPVRGRDDADQPRRHDRRRRRVRRGVPRRLARPRSSAGSPRPPRSSAARCWATGRPCATCRRPAGGLASPAGRSAAAAMPTYPPTMIPADRLAIAPEVADALRDGTPVVALESTLISHGLPVPAERRGRDGLRGGGPRVRRRAGDGGAERGPAAGRARRRTSSRRWRRPRGARVLKVSRPNLGLRDRVGRLGRDDGRGHDDRGPARPGSGCSRPAASAASTSGRSTATQPTLDISADLDELARTRVAVVCAGPKAILDVPRTLEYLETRGRAGGRHRDRRGAGLLQPPVRDPGAVARAGRRGGRGGGPGPRGDGPDVGARDLQPGARGGRAARSTSPATPSRRRSARPTIDGRQRRRGHAVAARAGRRDHGRRVGRANIALIRDNARVAGPARRRSSRGAGSAAVGRTSGGAGPVARTWPAPMEREAG